MKIISTQNSNFNNTFNGNIDMHVHKGNWWVELSEAQAANLPSDKIKRTPNGVPHILHECTHDMFEIANSSIPNPQNQTEKIITSNLDCIVRNHPDVSISTTFKNGIPFLKNETEGNLELLKNSTNPNEFLYATGQPGYGNAETLKKVIETNPKKFIGIKIHPTQLNIPASDKVYEPYIKLAQEKQLPCLFHSGVSIDWSTATAIENIKNWNPGDPRLIYELAKKYPKVPIILGHTGAGGAPAHAIAMETFLKSLANNDANLYCDISWMDFTPAGLPSDSPQNVLRLIKEAQKKNALDKILFGSDMPVGAYGQLKAEQLSTTPSEVYRMTVEKLQTAIKNDEELKHNADSIIEKIFSSNSKKLFFSNSTNTPLTANIQKNKNIKIALGIGAAFMGLAGYLYYANEQNSNSEIIKETTSASANIKTPKVFSSFKVLA